MSFSEQVGRAVANMLCAGHYPIGSQIVRGPRPESLRLELQRQQVLATQARQAWLTELNIARLGLRARPSQHVRWHRAHVVLNFRVAEVLYIMQLEAEKRAIAAHEGR
jgi:hypothetical protein